jgi:ATP-dependent DNA helicase RecG
LMSSFKLSSESKERIATMVRTTNGFEIAEADLKLRGPGAIAGTRQSGVLDLRIADLAKDGIILQTARQLAKLIMDKDPNLTSEANKRLKWWLDNHGPRSKGWSKIS